MADPQQIAQLLMAPQGGAFGTMTPQEQGEVQPNILDKIVAALSGNLATLPKRAIEGAAQYQPGSGEIPSETLGPALETAMMMTGGAGAFPAEANSLRAGIRTYKNAPDSLMGYRRNGPQKGFEETAYPHVQEVAVTLPKTGGLPQETFRDQVKGMNGNHAMERAWRNWPNALHITPIVE